MKYISGRDEFLRKSINKVNEFKSLEEKYPSLKEEYKSSDFELILEDSGPFANDIPWGDSLLGRLINSTIRKAKIQANLVRMKGVVSRLKSTFDDLLLESKVNDLEESDLAEWAKIRNFTYLYNLEKAVKNMHVEKTPLQEIKNLTNIAIEKTEETADIPKKNELLRQLNEWKKFLDSIKEEDNVTEEDMDPEKKAERISGEKVYLAYVANFQSALRIVNKFIVANQKRAASAPAKLSDAEKAELAKKKVPTTGATTTTVGATQSVNASHEYEFNWVYSINEATPPVPPAPPKSDSKVYNLIKSLHGVVAQIMPPKEKGSQIEGINDFLKKDINALKNDQYKTPIKKVYQTVAKITKIGDIASSENDINALLARPEDLGKRMAELYIVSKTKEDGKFEGLDKELQDELAIFNTTMKGALYYNLQFGKQQSTEKSNKPEDKKESIIKKYDLFMKVFEADEPEVTQDKKEEDKKEDKSGEVGDRPKSGFITKIQDWWGQNMDLKEWMMDKAEVEKIRINLDKKLAEKKDSVTISSIDPVLEICKIFNRSYRIHTTQVIPTGRSGGKVSNKTYMEYTCFGSGSPANAGEGGGPYRNNKLFDQWYDAVMDILKEKKYQPIFNVGTRMKVGDEYIDRAGSNLGKFMRDMLEGDEFFTKSKDGGGPQSKFLDKYFGYKDPANIEKDTAYEGSAEMDEISTVAGSMPKPIDIRFVKTLIPYTEAKELVGTFFAIKDKTSSEYTFFFIQSIDGDFAYVLFSNGFGKFKNSISRGAPKGNYNSKDGDVKLGNNVTTETNSNGLPWSIYGAKIAIKTLINVSGEIANTNKKTLTGIGLSKDDESKIVVGGGEEKGGVRDEITPSEIITLIKLEGEVPSNNRYKLSKAETDKLKTPFSKLLREIPEINSTSFK
jgi:hypothetical protein